MKMLDSVPWQVTVLGLQAPGSLGTGAWSTSPHPRLLHKTLVSSACKPHSWTGLPDRWNSGVPAQGLPPAFSLAVATPPPARSTEAGPPYLSAPLGWGTPPPACSGWSSTGGAGGLCGQGPSSHRRPPRRGGASSVSCALCPGQRSDSRTGSRTWGGPAGQRARPAAPSPAEREAGTLHRGRVRGHHWAARQAQKGLPWACDRRVLLTGAPRGCLARLRRGRGCSHGVLAVWV